MIEYFEPLTEDDIVILFNDYFRGWINKLVNKYSFIYNDISRDPAGELREDLELEFWQAWHDFDKESGTSFKTLAYSYLNNFIKSELTEWNRRKETGYVESLPIKSMESDFYVNEFVKSIDELVTTMLGAASFDKLLDSLSDDELALVKFILDKYESYRDKADYKTIELPVEIDNIETPEEPIVQEDLVETIEIPESKTVITDFWRDLNEQTGWSRFDVFKFFNKHPKIKELMKDKIMSMAKKIAKLEKMAKMASQ